MRHLTISIAIIALGCHPSHDPDANPDRTARSITSAEGDIGVVVDGHNALAWDLYGEMAAGQDENVFFSPFSVTAAMGMVLAGADGESRDELLELLHVGLDELDWHWALGDLIRDLNGDLGRGYTLHVANRLFGQEAYPWEEDFLAVCDEAYDAPFQPWDFIADPEGGRQEANDWVAEQTEQRIKELLPQGSVDVDTRMILANAIYFLADWADQFDPDDTYERTFTRLDGTTEQVPTMHLDLNAIEDHRIQTGWTDDARIARLPYQDDEVSMIVVLPHQHDGLPEIDATLDAPTFEGWLQSLGGASDTLGLPRFQAEWELELSDVIADLGAPSLFSDATADLTRMADTDEDLFVTGIFHKAFVKVDEEGTEAAAATGAVVGVESASEPFIVNRPFLFVIQDDLTGAILFTGRITDPLAG